jgi:tetratricopeptide (TPR) repeat protein
MKTMRKFLLTLAVAATAISANAQNLAGTTLNDRIGHGQDSIDVLGSLSLYQDAFKRKSYVEAIEPWEFVFQKAPLSMVRVYTDGAWMFEQLVQKETDAQKKKEYFDKLMAIYDQRLKNLDALNSFATAKTTSTKGNIITRKAYDYYYFCPNMNNNEAYKMFKEGIEDLNKNVEAFVLYGFIECSYNRFVQNKENTDIRQDFIQDYMFCNEICDMLLDQAKEYPSQTIPADPDSEDSTKWVEQVILAPEALKIIQNYQPTQEQCNNLFVQSGAADCDALEKIYMEKVEANKTDIKYLNAVLAILTNFECDKSNIYYTAADYAYQITKTPQAAIGKASRLLKEGKETEALDYFKEAIDMETNEAKKAKYAYVIAALYFKKGNTAACRQWCRETLKYNPSNGGAYLLQANCIARGAYGKSPKDVATSYYYCLASDYCNKAKAVDPSSAAKASRQAAGYAAHFYPKSEAFFAGIKAGQAVSCMGETTILRLR